jgi:glycosidase
VRCSLTVFIRNDVRHPTIYQLNTRVLLHERGVALGRPATLDDVSDAFLDDIAAMGFHWVWPLGVWQTGTVGRDIARSDPALVEEWTRVLPDLRDEDITGSPFAIVAYDTHRDFGGDEALARLRERLVRRSVALLLDFVPNHVALDHPWVTEHPEYFVHGSEHDLVQQPRNYVRSRAPDGRILAHGRDPYFEGWRDTLQLDYRHAELRAAQIRELARVSDRCDGVRCDMAMLLQPQVFARTWADRAPPLDGTPVTHDPFWPAALAAIRRRHPRFTFVAEVYWDMEWGLQQAGFDYTYDKRLYDRLVAQSSTAVRDHLSADPLYQDRSMRFLENHDEPRAAAVFPRPVHEAAAVIALLAPGLRFVHEGQIEGRTVHVPMQLARRPAEPVDGSLRAFYERLFAALARPEVHEGEWRRWDCRPAWEGNPTHASFVVTTWQASERRLLCAVNYGPTQAQCRVSVELPGLRGRGCTLVDLLGDARYERDGDALTGDGLYLDMPAWGRHVFELQSAGKK